MEVKCVVTGYLDENCYILIKNGNCIVVDPGDDYNNIKESIGDNKVLSVLITHSHVDHIGALRNFLTKRNIKILSYRDKRMARNKASRKNKTTTISPLKKTNLVFKKKNI